MIVLAALALAALGGLGALVVAWLVSVRGDGSGTRSVGAAVLAGAAVALVLTALLVGGVDAGSDSQDRRSSPPDATAPEGGEAVPLRKADVRLVAHDPDDLPPIPEAVGGLVDGTALVVDVAGLEPGSRATVHQCPVGSLLPAACQPGLPFRMSETERATVLIELRERLDASPHRIDCTEAPCSLVVFGSARLELLTTFGGATPPPVVVRTEPRAVEPGGEVTATARDLPPGARASFTVCRPGGGSTLDCGEPADHGIVDRSGRAEATVEVGAGRCPRGATCAVAVTIDGGAPLAYARLQVIGRAGAGYEEARLRAGLVAAGLLLAGALLLLRRTDWTPVEGDPFAGVILPEDPFADDPPR